MSKNPGQVPCPLREVAISSPDAPAIVGAEETLSYSELDRLVSAASRRLGELGLGLGARVAIYLPKDERYVVLVLALIRAGAVACPLSTRLPPSSVEPLLRRAGCQALISDDEEALDAISGNIEKLHPEEVLMGEAVVEDHARSRLRIDSPATLVFTSGSTGTPKAALHTFGNHYYSALGSNENIALGPGGRWLLSLPLYHVGGLSILFRCLLEGAAMVLPGPREKLGGSIARYGITHVSLVSTQLRRLLSEGDAPESLEAVLLGASGIPASLLEEATNRSLPIYTSYGLTEMASQVTTTSGASRDELETSGRALPYREVSISDEGEILVRGETLFAGYVEGDEIERPLDEEGWFHTKDLGEIDAEGYLRVLGRRDNLFISGGENIQPEEVEEALLRLENVVQAAVAPVPDSEFGSRPVAFVRTTGGYFDSESLRASLEKVLPRFKVPVAFHEWPAEASTESAKVDRALFGRLALENAKN
ncbi:MAG: o-succinylbenzoate--CoA ligase [Rubrobacteraceae bacterium]